LRETPLREGERKELGDEMSEMSEEMSEATKVLAITISNYLAPRI
jgi:hypothetical protein